MSLCDDACTILRLTRDGNDLAPADLALVEAAVNQQLTPEGLRVFQTLSTTVQQGTYRQPWLHGFEHLTIDHQGYVRWKEQIVEHYTPGWASSPPAREAAQELVRRCQILESRGTIPTMTTAIWKWNEHTVFAAPQG